MWFLYKFLAHLDCDLAKEAYTSIFGLMVIAAVVCPMIFYMLLYGAFGLIRNARRNFNILLSVIFFLVFAVTFFVLENFGCEPKLSNDTVIKLSLLNASYGLLIAFLSSGFVTKRFSKNASHIPF